MNRRSRSDYQNRVTRTDDNGNTHWSARALATAMGYRGTNAWINFQGTLDRARESAANIGVVVEENFLDNQEVSGARGPARHDVRLTRWAAYLVAMNGDSRKPQVAAAQAYFTQATLMQEGHLPSTAQEPVQEDPQPTASGPIVGVPVELATSLVSEITGVGNLDDLHRCTTPECALSRVKIDCKSAGSRGRMTP